MRYKLKSDLPLSSRLDDRILEKVVMRMTNEGVFEITIPLYYTILGRQAYLKATKVIRAGTEITTPYGAAYWKAVRDG